MKDYHSTHMVEYEQPVRYSSCCIRVLRFLEGRKWDERSLAFVHTLRPSSIRVTTGEEKSDARTWRVTVLVDDDDIIRAIHQEAQVGMAPGWSHGLDAMQWADAEACR